MTAFFHVILLVCCLVSYRQEYQKELSLGNPGRAVSLSGEPRKHQGDATVIPRHALSSYTPSMAEVVPITSVEKPPIPVAG